MLGEMEKVYEQQLKNTPEYSWNNPALGTARENIEYLKKLKVKDATRDAIAVTSDFDPEKKTVFGFRGTAKIRDLVPDIQLALNSKKVGRLEEAKEFVKRVAEREGLKGADMKFTGHSLGGTVICHFLFGFL